MVAAWYTSYVWEVSQLAPRLLLDQTGHSDSEFVEDKGAL
jgi:hypothetical protein